MGGATIPTPGKGVGTMAFPSAAEPNPIAQGLRGNGPEQIINQIGTPQGPGGGGGTPPVNPPPPDAGANLPTFNFGDPYASQGPGAGYWQIQNGGINFVSSPGQDTIASVLANTNPLSFNTAQNSFGIQGGSNGQLGWQPGSSNMQTNPQTELSFLQQTYPYQAPPPAFEGMVQGQSFPNYWANSQMQQWKGPSVFGGQ